jgi:AraC family transcriptional activator of pobA
VLAGGSRLRDYVTMIFVEGGRGRHRQGPATWEAPRGSLFVAAPGETHDGHGLGTATGWVVRFVPSALVGPAAGDEIGLPQPGDPLWFALVRTQRMQHVVPEAKCAAWSVRLESLEDELRTRGRGYAQAARAITFLLLIDLARLAQAEPPRERLQQQAIADMFEYIEEHYGEDISLVDVAVALARSPANLARTARRFTGRSVNDWIAERRMAEARALLAQSDEPIDRIARSAGFQDPSYFRRRFKQAHGFAPREWRRAAR